MTIGLAIYIVAVLWLADWIGEMHLAVATLFYICAGTVWVFAVKPLFRWTSRDRVPDNWGAH